MADLTLNPWKLATIGLLLVGATALVTTFVVGQKSDTESTSAPAKPQKKNAAIEHHRNTQTDIDTCNRLASSSMGDKTTEVLKDTAVGAVGGAGVGAAGGAIAQGGKGAGKGAAIGGLLGAVGGALYGVNENKQQDEQYRAAYASCMRSRGYE